MSSSSSSTRSNINPDDDSDSDDAGSEPSRLFNSDEEFDGDVARQPTINLSWSTANPLEVHSDFSIEISSTTNSERQLPTTYYVHKAALVFSGDERKSDYFETMFDTKLSVRENAEAVSKIELAPPVAAAFPTMLDFIYFPFVFRPDNVDIEVTSSNAVPLRVLSKYFGIRALHKLVNKFITADISACNCVGYMLAAEACNDMKLISITTKKCAKCFRAISITKAILSLSPETLQSVVSEASFDADSSEYSAQLMKYMESRPDDLSLSHIDAYHDLLCCERMPSIDLSACVFFLPLDVDENVYKCTTCKTKGCLYDRCVKSYAANWSERSLDLDLGFLPLKVQKDLMRAALTRARSITRQIMPVGSQILMCHTKLKSFNKALERMDKREILVSGAEVKEINGVYVLVGLFDGYRRYSKGVYFRGHTYVSEITYGENTEGEMRWWLGEHHIGHYCYFDDAVSAGIANEYPPIGKWEFSSRGAFTARVSYLR